MENEESTMIVQNFKDCEMIKIDKFPYRGTPYAVKGVSVRWLSKCGEDDMGTPEYGLRHFTAEREARFLFTTIFTTRPCIS